MALPFLDRAPFTPCPERIAMPSRRVPGTKYVPPRSPSGPNASDTPGQYGAIRLYAGSAAGSLGDEAARSIGIKLIGADILRFSNDNTFLRPNTSRRTTAWLL